MDDYDIKPCIFHLSKLGLELKCPLCLGFFNQPLLLSCGHIFCDDCTPRSDLSLTCRLCNSQQASQDIKQLSFLQNIVNIYRGLHASFSARLLQSNPVEDGKDKSGSSTLAEAKGSENDSSIHGQSPKNNLAQLKRNPSGKHKLHISTEIDLNDSKRPKKSSYDESEESGHDGVCHTQTKGLENSHVGLEIKSEALPQQSPAKTKNMSAKIFTCQFCNSSKISNVTGPILHYANGNLVKEEDAHYSKVIHVHSLCINWAPKVYYDGELVKNLNAELARGAKLKCGKCGKKGATLGCYMSSCHKSYHVTCAVEMPKCRWDYDNFLLLCPKHASHKFPKEKHTISAQRICLPSTRPVTLPSVEKELVFCGSALSSEELILLVRFGGNIGAKISKIWRPSVTHVIAATDKNGAFTRTMKVFMAILNGKWVLNINWIKACMETTLVDEVPYELGIDNYGSRDGPKTGRLRAMENAPKLFEGLKFYFCGDFDRKENLEDLVIAGGGSVIEMEEKIVAGSLVVYSLDVPEESLVGEQVSINWKRFSEAGELADRSGSQVINHTWILESIAAHKVQPYFS